LTAETLLGNGTSVVRGLFIEMFLTSAFVFSVFMLATEKHKGAGAVSRQSSALFAQS
jgi:aquaporin related protein